LKNFNEKILESKKIDIPDRIDTLIKIFGECKYKFPFESIIVLYNLKGLFDDTFQVDFHLFNHFTMIKLFDESLEIITELENDEDRFFYFIRKYPIDERFVDKGINDIKKILKNGVVDREYLSRTYYELALKSLKLVDENISDRLFNNAIKFAKGNVMVKMILSRVNFLLKDNRREEGINLLSDSINSYPQEEVLQLMYKLATIYENSEPLKSIQLYENILKMDHDFLDVSERINKLTNNKNEYKIKNIDIFENFGNDDDNIHFI